MTRVAFVLTERVITFIVLGFFIFVADVGSWWQSHSLTEWYGNYVVCITLVLLCYLASRRESKKRPGTDINDS